LGEARLAQVEKVRALGKVLAHKADHYARMMNMLGWQASNLATAQGISRAAVCQVMCRHKLSAQCQRRMRELNEPNMIRTIGRRQCSRLMEVTEGRQEKMQLKTLSSKNETGTKSKLSQGTGPHLPSL